MKRELMISTAVLCGLAAATLFLCARPGPAAAPDAAAASSGGRGATAGRLPALVTAAHAGTVAPAGTPSGAAPLAQAMQAADLVWRADRHAADALRLADRVGDDDGLAWNYVQLRL